jgi:hypothetical protein
MHGILDFNKSRLKNMPLNFRKENGIRLSGQNNADRVKP